MKISEITTKLKAGREMLVTAGAVIAAVIGGYWWLQDSIRERELATVERYAEILTDQLVERIERKLDPVSTADFMAAMDSVLYEQTVHGAVNEALHMRTLRRQDSVLLLMDARRRSDMRLAARLDTLERALNRLRGVADMTREEAAAAAYTDSLQNELLLIRQRELDRARMRQMEDQHREAMKHIREIHERVNPDRKLNGKTKTPRGFRPKSNPTKFKAPI